MSVKWRDTPEHPNPRVLRILPSHTPVAIKLDTVGPYVGGGAYLGTYRQCLNTQRLTGSLSLFKLLKIDWVHVFDRRGISESAITGELKLYVAKRGCDNPAVVKLRMCRRCSSTKWTATPLRLDIVIACILNNDELRS